MSFWTFCRSASDLDRNLYSVLIRAGFTTAIFNPPAFLSCSAWAPVSETTTQSTTDARYIRRKARVGSDIFIDPFQNTHGSHYSRSTEKSNRGRPQLRTRSRY